MSTYSPNLRLELIGTGEQQGTWGVTTNTNLGTLLEEAIGGYVSVPVTDGADTTLTVSNGAADQSRNMVLNLTGALTADRTVICPAIEKLYVVKNATTGGKNVTFKVSGQTGVSIPNGYTYLLYVNGIDAYSITQSMASQSASGVDITGGTINVGDYQIPRSDIQVSGSSNPTAVVVGSISGATLDVTAVSSGTLAVGDRLFVSGLDYNTYITALGTGSGGVGTYTLNQNATLASTTIYACPSAYDTFTFYNSDTTSIGNQPLGGIEWFGSDASTPGAGVKAYIAAISESTTPDSSLIFGTSDNASGSLAVERMRISSSGQVGIGSVPSAGVSLSLFGYMGGAADTYLSFAGGVVQSTSNASATGFFTAMGTDTASFTLPSLAHFGAYQGAIGAGSSVTVQYGFISTNTLIGATTNYGFHAQNTAAVTSGKTAYGFFSNLSVASGGGTTWAFYGSGTANSFFGGSVGIGTTVVSGTSLVVAKNITGGTTAHSILTSAAVSSDVTNIAYGYRSYLTTAAATFTLTNLYHLAADQGGSIGAGSSVTNQVGFFSGAANIGATNNFGFYASNTAAVTAGKTAYGFYSLVNTATGGGTTYSFYSGGTAPNLFSGNVLVFGAGAIGYTTGSGGTVTQATSRTTGVTLNKTNGAITLVSAAGTTAWQSFTVTNSTVAATDTIIVNQKSGTDIYQIFVTAVGAGSFRITFATTSGTTTEQPVFNFAVIKAVTS